MLTDPHIVDMSTESVAEIQDRVILNEDRLAALYATKLLDSPPDSDFDRLTELTGKLLKTGYVFVTLVDAHRHFFLSMYGLPVDAPRSAAPPLKSFCQNVVVTNTMHVIDDAATSELVVQGEAQNDFGIIAYLGTPLRTPNDERIGTLCVVEGAPRTWSQREQELITQMGELVVKEIALRYHANEHLRSEQDIAKHISALQRANDALEHKNKELQKAYAVKSNFLATMSHEIRTPMNGVIGFTTLLLDTDLDYLQREYTETIRASGEALLDIINDVLDYSAIESGNIKFDAHPFSIHQCVSEALDVISLKAAQKELEIGYAIDTSVPEVLLGDVRRIRQILVNLLGNAVKFTSEGEIGIEVYVDDNVAADAGTTPLHFMVRDTGIGIPDDKFESIFNSFSQVDASTGRRYGGTGLGLSICKALCTHMGGTIWVESKENQGSAFHFILNLESSDRPVAQELRVPDSIKGKHLLIGMISGISQKHLKSLCALGNIKHHFVTSDTELEILLDQNNQVFDALLIDPDNSDLDDKKLLDLTHLWSRYTPVILLQKLGMQQSLHMPFASGTLHKPIKKSLFYSLLEQSVRQNPQREKIRQNGITNGKHPHVKQLKILIAEDNTINQQLLLRYLQVLGYGGDIVATGSEVIKQIEVTDYDVILMDINMPDLDGIEVTRQLRAKGLDKEKMYIIGITAGVKEDMDKQCLGAGMNDFMSKPISKEGLQAALEKAVAFFDH